MRYIKSVSASQKYGGTAAPAVDVTLNAVALPAGRLRAVMYVLGQNGYQHVSLSFAPRSGATHLLDVGTAEGSPNDSPRWDGDLPCVEGDVVSAEVQTSSLIAYTGTLWALVEVDDHPAVLSGARP